MLFRIFFIFICFFILDACEKKELINPLVKENKFHEIQPFKSKLEKVILNEISTDMISSASVFFYSLSDGMSFGINEDVKMPPASLLKVPLMMVWYKEAEKDSEILNKKLVYKKNVFGDSLVMNIKDLEPLENDKSYTVEKLIEHMIEWSDNDAMVALFNGLDKKKLYKEFYSLGINLPKDLSSDDFRISAKKIAAIFRVLYNASYLNEENSERALAHLSKTEFHWAIEDGVPEDVIVAHKFGERSFGDSNIKYLHDCGIVYNERFPYILCIMTTGYNLNRQAVSIKRISKFVYEEIERQLANPATNIMTYED